MPDTHPEPGWRTAALTQAADPSPSVISFIVLACP
jgi:hypothetical protein